MTSYPTPDQDDDNDEKYYDDEDDYDDDDDNDKDYVHVMCQQVERSVQMKSSKLN